MRVLIVFLFAAQAAIPAALRGQSLAEELDGLFRFGSCGDPLCLSVSGPANHGSHFLFSTVEANGTMASFLKSAVAASVGSLPFVAASGQELFSVGGAGVTVTQVSPGPIFAERSHTIGQGNFMIGATLSLLDLQELRGVDMDELQFAFTHEDDDGQLGSRAIENDLIFVDASLRVSLLATSIIAAYGLGDRLDVSVLVPIIRASMFGESRGAVDSGTGGTDFHRFDLGSGSVSESARSTVDAAASGLGDVGVRLKLNVHQTTAAGLAFIGDVRLPTGSEDDFLGAGEASMRGIAAASAQIGSFAPHLNVGMEIGGADRSTSTLATVGFDQRLGASATLAVELLGVYQTGEIGIEAPGVAEFDPLSPRGTVLRTNIPNKKDHLTDASIGLKLNGGPDVRVVANVILPLGTGGLRPTAIWTLGLERVFRGLGG